PRPHGFADRPGSGFLHRQPRAGGAGQGRDRGLGLLHRLALHRRRRRQLRRTALQLMGDYSSLAAQIVNEIVVAIANWATAVAVASIRWLVAGLGHATEPDLSVIVPIYDRVLAISLLLLGAIVALALIERIAWGSSGTGLALIPRVVAATFAAYVGFGLIKYVAGYAALLATVWTPDFSKLNSLLIHSVAVGNAVVENARAGPHVS